MNSQKILWVCATSQYILSIPKDFFNKGEFDLIHGLKDCGKKVTGDLERIIEGAKATSELA